MATRAHDSQWRFHEVWLGLAQPFEGLVFSLPVLADAQIAPRASAELTPRFLLYCEEREEGLRVPDLRALFEGFLEYSTPGMLIARDALPEDLSFYAAEGGQEIRPSFALARGPFKPVDDDPFGGFSAPESTAAAAAEETEGEVGEGLPLALVWDLRDDLGTADDHPEVAALPFDKAEAATGPWRYPPAAKMERLLRHTGIAIGLLSNGRELRLIYAPARESASHLTFRFADMADTAGRPLLTAFELLLGAARCHRAAAEHSLEGLLAESRRRQADVTRDLAEQVFEGVELLLEGFEQAWLRERGAGQINWLSAALEEGDDHFYQGVLGVVLRLVFLLYAEDKGLLPVDNGFYSRHLSLQGLYDELVEDAGHHPESMHHRFAAYGRLLTLFRAVYVGVEHGDLYLPPRRGRLFDPNTWPFLEGGRPGGTAAITSAQARSQVRVPLVDDGVIRQVLSRLVVFQGQRLSYRALDVAQIGSVYESLMGFHVLRVGSPAVRLGKARVWVELAVLRGQSARQREKWLKEVVKLSTAQRKRVQAALAERGDDAERADVGEHSDDGEHGDHAEQSDDALAAALLELAPGRRAGRQRHFAAPGQLVLQPGEERRRSGSHYTPRSLTEPIVRRTLEPLLACLGEAPGEEEILSLKICDPAMGSGAFLVEVCRQLADVLVAVWTRQGRGEEMAEALGDPHLHARRLVAQRCLYGVDKNAAAVELAKLSLWIVTLAADLPFTFLDHALRHGDSLVGLGPEQITAFHWQPKAQLELFSKELRDALEQAIEHRQELLALAAREDAVSQQEKRRLLNHAEWATGKIRLVADVCVGAFFAADKAKEREVERVRRLDLVTRYLGGDLEPEGELRLLAEKIREQHAPFHWWLEFPEVFYEERPDPLAGGEAVGATLMEGFVGNPPFMGVAFMTGRLGAGYVPWLMQLHPGTKGKFDFSAHFFRRAASLLGRHGVLGFVATNTISEGDTRLTGLKALLSNRWSIYDATKTLPWPGAAAVTVSVVHMSAGKPSGYVTKRLNGSEVDEIDSRLQPKLERPDAQQLESNRIFSFNGWYLRGMGFALTPAARDDLISRDIANSSQIMPYIGGDEVNSTPTQTFDRYVINFGQMELAEAEEWPDLIDIVRMTVKPERDKVTRVPHRKYWWRFAETRPALAVALALLDCCLVTSRHQPHLIFAFQPADRVFSEALYVFPLDTHTAFAVLQSRIHEHWARLFSSSMKTDLRYTASKCFATFPFPQPDPRAVIDEVEAAGKALNEARAAFMIDTDQGLTKTYNALKDPENHDSPIVELRHLHEAMDRVVLDAYGWTEVEVPPFCPQSEADQARLQAFEDEVIDRLYVLNAERAREEKRLGQKPGRGKKKKAAPRAGRGHPEQRSLFGDGEA